MTTTQLPTAPKVTPRAWLGAGVALAAVGWGANQFAPLIVLYQIRVGLSPAVVDAMFGLYALGLVPALLAGGRISDAVGRRPVVLPALLVSFAATCLLMAGGTDPTWLYAGRFLAGVASGLAFGTGAAWLKELSTGAGDAAAGPRRATIAMTAGFAAGPFVAGAAAQWLPSPAVTAYIPHLLLLIVAVAVLRHTPDPRRTGPAAGPGAWQRETVRHFVRVLLPFAPWVFGTAAIALAYLPALVASRVGHHALLFSAAATAITAAAGIVAQPLAAVLRRRTAGRLIPASMVIVLLSVGSAAWAAGALSPGLVLAASVLLGVAYGVAQFAGLIEVQQIAGRDSLGAATAIYQVLSYLGFAVPFLLSLAQSRWHLSPPLLLTVVLGIATLATAWLTTHRDGNS